MAGKIKPGVALGLAALAATVIASPAVAGASTATRNSASGAAVATGTITSVRGAAMPGAAVDLYAWPSDAVLAAMKPGQLVPRTLLTTTTTNSAGKYTLRVQVARLETAAVDSGYANLEIDSPAGGSWFLPYQTGSLPTKPPAPVTVNLKRNATVNCGKDQFGHPYSFFAWTLVHHEHPANAVVGQGYIAPSRKTRRDWVNFQYNLGSGHTQASSLGVGLSGYGLDAGYSSSGAKTSTATRTEGYHNSHQNAWFRTEFKVNRYRGLCYEVDANTKVPRVNQHPKNACPRKWLPPGDPNVPGNYHYIHKCYWLVASAGWFGGSTQVHPRSVPATPAGNCAIHQAGDHFNNDFGSAIEWSNGFTIGAAIGIKGVNLKADFGSTAHTGYDINAVMYFKFNQRSRLCGTNGSEATAAILVVRRPR